MADAPFYREVLNNEERSVALIARAKRTVDIHGVKFCLMEGITIVKGDMHLQFLRDAVRTGDRAFSLTVPGQITEANRQYGLSQLRNAGGGLGCSLVANQGSTLFECIHVKFELAEIWRSSVDGPRDGPGGPRPLNTCEVWRIPSTSEQSEQSEHFSIQFVDDTRWCFAYDPQRNTMVLGRERDFRLCDACGVPEAHKHCTCMQARYCNKDCQKKHWKEHKATCKTNTAWLR